MALQKIAGFRIGEDSDDLERWLTDLDGCPEVTVTFLVACDDPGHDEPPTWFFVEGDAAGGIGRRRCLACGDVRHLLDSAEHWTHPPMRSCGSCGQAMFEVGIGLHTEDGRATWLVAGVRCVGCGCLDGLTDLHVPGLTVDEVRARV